MKLKITSIILIILIGMIVTIITISNIKSKDEEFNGYIASARTNAQRQIPYTSVQKYRAAFNIKNDDESIYREYLEQAKLLGDSFYSDAVKNYPLLFPTVQAYEDLCMYYYKSESYNSVLKIALEAKQMGMTNDKIKDLYLECFYMYKYIKTGFEEAKTFLGNYALVKKDGLYGYITDTGSYMIMPVYKNAMDFLGNTTAVEDAQEWHMINTSGYKIARASIPVDSLSFVSNGKIRVSKNGKYGFTDSGMEIPANLPFDMASNYKNGIAAVCKNSKWALMDVNGNIITDFIFEDIKLDEYDTCINGDVIFAKYNEKYYMINSSGQKICDTGYDDVYPFVTSEPAAVCINEKWGFIDKTGKIVIEPQYTQAKSFSNGLAPVSTNGMWGYINLNNEYRISSQFNNCLPFSSNGIAAIQENGVWNYIKLLAYYK